VSFGLAFLARCSDAGRGCAGPILFNILPMQLVSTNRRIGLEFDRNGGLGYTDNERVKQKNSEIHRAQEEFLHQSTVKTTTTNIFSDTI
jgi:hypothetical protein